MLTKELLKRVMFRSGYTTLISCAVICSANFIASLVLVLRIKKTKALLYSLAIVIYSFFSSFFYCFVLQLCVSFTYELGNLEWDERYLSYWGIGIGFGYLFMIFLVSGFLK